MVLNSVQWIGLVFGIVFFGGIITLLIYGVYSLRKNQVKPNASLVLNFANYRSGGYLLGVETDINPQWHTKVLTKYKPLDIAYDAKGKPIPDIEQQVPARQSLWKNFAPGSLSQRRNIICVFPENASDLDPDFLKSDMGQMFGLYIETKRGIELSLDLVKQGAITQKNAAIELQSGEIVQKLKKMYDNILETMIKKPVEEALKPQEKGQTQQ